MKIVGCLQSRFVWLGLSYSSTRILLCVRFWSVHAWSLLDGLPQMSNFDRCPASARGPPRLADAARCGLFSLRRSRCGNRKNSDFSLSTTPTHPESTSWPVRFEMLIGNAVPRNTILAVAPEFLDFLLFARKYRIIPR